MRRDHYLGWRNFTAVSRSGRVWHDPMDWQGLQRSREIAGQVRADVKRLQARQEEQYRNGIRCPVIGGER